MEIKDRILQHAQTLFMRNGIKSVSMDDIAADMAMSKKTLYKWFENKDQIVMAGIAQHLTGVQGECGAIAGKAADAVEEMLLLSKRRSRERLAVLRTRLARMALRLLIMRNTCCSIVAVWARLVVDTYIIKLRKKVVSELRR